jgi:hypothetical protein
VSSAVGHSLTLPDRLRGRTGIGWPAELFAAGPTGHESIETTAFRGLGRREINQIYFGNWQRDLSQMLVPMIPTLLSAAQARLLCQLIFEVVDVMAEAKFGRRLKRRSFGVYRWEEHCDNPRKYGIALDPGTYLPIPKKNWTGLDNPEASQLQGRFWREAPNGLQKYLEAARGYVLGQLGEAVAAGPTPHGRELFGNALHAVEDWYSHSNFVELGLRRFGWRGDPMTGHLPGRPGQPLFDSRCRPRLVTGVYLLGDTVVSLEELLLSQIRGPRPGQSPSVMSARIRRVLARRLLPPDAYVALLRLERAWIESGIPALGQAILNWTGLTDLQRAFQVQIERPLRLAITRLLHPLVEASAAQTGNKAFPTVISGRIVPIVEPSHSRLGKDDPKHPRHQLARRLAIAAAADFWCEMDATWNRGGTTRGPLLTGTRFALLVDRYMNHPQAAGDWWVPLLRVQRPPRPRRSTQRQPTPQPSQPSGRRVPVTR